MTRKLINILLKGLFLSLILIGCSSQGVPTAEDVASMSVEFRYQNPEASEVTLVWGVNGWGVLPQEDIPPGTQIQDGLMHTSMSQEGEKFIAKLIVPPWMTIDYGFLVIKSSNEPSSEPIWDGSESYQIQMTEQDEIVEIAPAISEPYKGDSALIDEDEIISHEISYGMPEAGEVFLIWGVDGWGVLPESNRPNGTEVVDNLMRTPMKKEGDTFSVAIRAPFNAKIDYGFLVTRNSDGFEIQPMWEGNEGFYIDRDTQGDAIEVDSGITLENAIVNMNSEVPSFESLKILYHLDGAGSVELVWGVDGWMILAEDQLPIGTSIVNGLMHTPMEKNGEEFTTEVQFPRGSKIDCGFLITSTENGEQVEIWEAKEDQGYSESMSSDGVLVVQSGVKFPSRQGFVNKQNLIVALYLVVAVLIVLLVGFIFDYIL